MCRKLCNYVINMQLEVIVHLNNTGMHFNRFNYICQGGYVLTLIICLFVYLFVSMIIQKFDVHETWRKGVD